MKKQVATIATLLPLFLIVLASHVSASEGYIKLNSTNGNDTYCNGFSALMPTLRYLMLIDCEGVVYPTVNNQFNYVAWVQPTDGGSPIRLGTLGVGTAEYEVNESFSQIFVTSESSSRPQQPSNTRVLTGVVSGSTIPEPTTDNNETPQTTSSPTPTPTENTSLFSRLFKASSLIPFVGVVILLVLVFILTRR